jgi:hypothetical protein
MNGKYLFDLIIDSRPGGQKLHVQPSLRKLLDTYGYVTDEYG